MASLVAKITAIADAIREVDGTEDTYTLDEMAERVGLLGSSGSSDDFDALVARTITEVADDDGSITEVGSYALYGCTSLASVDLPACTSVGSSAFYGCTSLASLTLGADEVCTLSSTNALTGTAIADGEGWIYVPADLVDEYKAATNWSTYADRITAIDEDEEE